MIGVVIAFFSPCDYQLPKQHLQQVLAGIPADVPLAVAQVVRPGQSPQPVPGHARSQTLVSDQAMFFKENLWNLGAELIDTDKLLFLDADLVFCDQHWLAKTEQTLDRADIVQPFSTASWLDRDGTVVFRKGAAAAAISAGRPPCLRRYHTGFSWGMTRRAFDAVGGWYDRCPCGGGDAAFALAISPESDQIIEDNAREQQFGTFSPSYASYRRNALARHLRVDFVPGEVRHLWHGDRRDRGYRTREQYFPSPVDREYPISRRPDGLFQWDLESPMALNYFQSRDEDGAHK